MTELFSIMGQGKYKTKQNKKKKERKNEKKL